MEIFRKALLMVVGGVSLAYEEAVKSVEQAAKNVQDQRKKLNDRFARTHA
jgi:hypothetical protein